MSATHFICPGCGAEIRVGSKGCPKCTRQPETSSKKETWEHDDIYDGADLDLPEDDPFNYEKFIAEEFGGQPKRRGMELIWWLTGVILLAVLFYLWV